MNKYLFLFELRKELTFMTPEDKELAVRYYEEYFADAGVENEKKVIEELGSPEKLAKVLREDYEMGRAEPTGHDLAIPGSEGQDEPPKAPNFGQQNPFGPRPVGQEWRRTGGKIPYGSWNYRPEEDPRTSESQGQEKAEEQYGGQSYSSNWGGEKKKETKIWLIVLLVVFAIPVGIPVAAALFSVIVALFSVVFALFVTLFASGLGLIGAGIYTFISGIWALGFLPNALIMFGSALVMIAVGMVLTWIGVFIVSKGFPGISRWIKRLYRRVTKRGGGPV